MRQRGKHTFNGEEKRKREDCICTGFWFVGLYVEKCISKLRFPESVVRWSYAKLPWNRLNSFIRAVMPLNCIPGKLLSWQKIFEGFLSSSQKMQGRFLRFSRDRFLPHGFQFVTHHSFDTTYCELLTASVNKVQINLKYEVEHGTSLLHCPYRTLAIWSIAHHLMDYSVDSYNYISKMKTILTELQETFMSCTIICD
jgi:hypothetical protein